MIKHSPTEILILELNHLPENEADETKLVKKKRIMNADLSQIFNLSAN